MNNKLQMGGQGEILTLQKKCQASQVDIFPLEMPDTIERRY